MPCPPFASCCFFSTSSAWMLWLAHLAWQEFPALSVALLITACASFYHWLHFSYSSPAGLLDRLTASLCFLYVAVRGHGTVHYAFAACSLGSFALGNTALLQWHWERHMFWHSMFRFCAFWMIHCFLLTPDRMTVVFYCVVYGFHWFVMWLWCLDEIMFMTRGVYSPPANRNA